MNTFNGNDGKVVEFLEKVSVEMVSNINSCEFFKKRHGLYVQDSFDKFFIDDNAQKVTGVIDFSKYKIVCKTNSFDLYDSLPEECIFEAGEFCQILSSLIKNQYGGTDGNLLNGGYHNIFFVRTKDKSRVVPVDVTFYSPACLSWNIYFWSLEEEKEKKETTLSQENLVFSRV